MSPRRSARQLPAPSLEVQDAFRRKLENTRKVVEAKLAWMERAGDFAHLSEEVTGIRKQLDRLETMILGLYAALEKDQGAQAIHQDGELDRYCVRAKEAAKFIGVAETTLAQWRMNGEGPPFVKNGPRSVLYRIGDLRTWIDNNVVTSTAAFFARNQGKK